MRAAPGLALRGAHAFSPVRSALALASNVAFRVIHFSVQADHLHLIVEADDKQCLSRGLAGLKIRAARALNRALARVGPVWRGKYHARVLRTPREMRAALVYVLQNWKKHVPAARGIDRRSSAPWFDGWTRPLEPPLAPSPVAPPRTWLASKGWRLRGGGPLRPDEEPATEARPRRGWTMPR